MATYLQVNYALTLTARETLVTNVPAATRKTVVHDGFNVAATLKDDTTPPVTKVAAFAKALVNGTATIDLTALTGTGGVTVDGTGLKVQALLVINPSTNTKKLLVKPGASSGYNLFGASSQLKLNPGEALQWLGYDSNNVPDVANNAKAIDLTDDGGNGNESYNFEFILG